jgi:hypothetical protein
MTEPSAPVSLRESERVGSARSVTIALEAEGSYRAGPPPGVAQAEPAAPLALKVQTRLDFIERVSVVDGAGRPRRVVRSVARAASAITGEVRPSAVALRPEVALLVAESRAEGVVVFSPAGPLTRSELELVQGAGDPLALPALLPEGPVAVGDRWKVGTEAAQALSAYDALAASALEARLEAVDDARATIRLSGDVRGAALGGEGMITCAGIVTFDRTAGRINRLSLTRTESRKPGPVEAGLDVKSTLTVDRRAVEIPAELRDDALAGRALEPDPQHERLVQLAPDGKYTLLHDRDWHIFWDDRRQTVLKRLDRGEVVAQCNLVTAPRAGRGRHQDLGQFRDDIRRALGSRFSRFVGAGEVDGDPAGGFRYKVGVQGRQRDLGVIWYYYLIASPEGDQLLVTFTMAESQVKAFADQDLRLVGSLRWTNPPPSTP